MAKKTIQTIEKKKANGRKRAAAGMLGLMGAGIVPPVAVATAATAILAACENGLTPPTRPEDLETVLDWVAETFGIQIDVKSTAPMTEDQKNTIVNRVQSALASDAFAEYLEYLKTKNYQLRVTIDNGAARWASRTVVGNATEGVLNLTLEQALAVDAAMLINFLNNQGIVEITPMNRAFPEFGGMRLISRAPILDSEKNNYAIHFSDAINSDEFAWYKQYLIDNSYALAIYIENGGDNAGEDGLHMNTNQAGNSAVANTILLYLNSIGITAPPVIIDTIMDQTFAQYGNARIISRAPITDEQKTAVADAFGAAYGNLDDWYKSQALVVKLYIENGGTNENEADGIHKDLAESQALTADQIVQFYNASGFTKPPVIIDTIMSRTFTEFGNAVVTSRAPMTNDQKIAIASAFTAAVNGTDAWYKNALVTNAGGFVLKLYVENGGTNANEADGMHKSESEALALSGGQIETFMISKGQEKPPVIIDTIMNQTFPQYGNAVIVSRAPLTDAAKVAIGNSFGAAYNTIDDWYKSQTLALKLYIENGTNAGEADGMHKELAGGALQITTQEIIAFYNGKGLTKPVIVPDTQLNYVFTSELNGLVSAKSSGVMTDAEKDSAKAAIIAAVNGAAWHKARMISTGESIVILIENNGELTGTGLRVASAGALNAAAIENWLNANVTAFKPETLAVSTGVTAQSRVPMGAAEKTTAVNGIIGAVNGADAWYKNQISSGAFVLKLYIENGKTAGTETDGMHRTPAQAQTLTSAEITTFMISKGFEKPIVIEDTKLVNESLNSGRVIVSSSAAMSDSEKALVKSAIESAVNGATWHLARMNAKSVVLTISVNNGGTNLTTGWVMTDTGAKALTAAQVESWLDANVAAFKPETVAVSTGVTAQSRVPLETSEKASVINGITGAVNGTDAWYKGQISSGAFVLKIYIENGKTTGAETDGMHRTSAQAQALTSAEVTTFMVSKGYEKPVTTILEETIASGRVAVKSSAAMSVTEKAAVKSAIESAVSGATWHLARMNAKSVALTISVNNGGTNLTTGWVMTDTAAKALTSAQVESWLDANVAEFKPDTLLTSSGITTKSRVPLDASEKTAATTKINQADQDVSFDWYTSHNRTITIWIENGKTAGTESGALHITYANLNAATNAGFAEQMAQVIDNKANLNKSVPASEYVGTKATIKTGLWLTTAEWSTIKTNIESAVNAQTWWKDNVGASQLKVDVGGTSAGYAQISKAQAEAGTSTIWPILKAFLETQTAFQSGNYSTDGWTIYYRMPMSGTQKGYIDGAIANLGWYKDNGGSYKKVYVNNGPDNLSDGGNGTVITGNPTGQVAVQNAIIGFLNGKSISEPTGPVYVDKSDPALPNLVIEHDSTLNIILADLTKIFDAYDPDGDSSVYHALRGKTIKVIIEASGTTYVDSNGVHVSKAWLDNSANSYIHLRGFLESFANTYAYTKPQQQNNFKIVLGNEVLASVRDGKFFNGNAFVAEEKRTIASQKRALDEAVNPIDNSRAGWATASGKKSVMKGGFTPAQIQARFINQNVRGA